jgi:hypothetical protein
MGRDNQSRLNCMNIMDEHLKRPICSVEECQYPCRIDKRRKDGSIKYKKCCSYHLKNKPKPVPIPQKLKKTLYRFKKLFCENKDGRLGYVCNFTMQIFSQLEVDHIDGDPYNNDLSNLQTLCCNCHRYKTMMNKDHRSPGRKK